MEEEIEVEYLTILDGGPIKGCMARLNGTGWKKVKVSKTSFENYGWGPAMYIELITSDFVLDMKE